MEEGTDANVSEFVCDVHSGTHIDAPKHFVRDGASVEDIPLEKTVGSATVARVPAEVENITAENLELLDIPVDADRLLLRTRNSSFWNKYGSAFQPNYAALAADAATWIVDRGISCIGVDYLSVQRYTDGPETHQTLLEAGVVIIEGLNLSEVTSGSYELLCMPLKIAGAEGAPARVALRACFE
jgi:arylformamidase